MTKVRTPNVFGATRSVDLSHLRQQMLSAKARRFRYLRHVLRALARAAWRAMHGDRTMSAGRGRARSLSFRSVR
jgi:hypothetical protein